MEPTTLYYTFSTIPQVIAAATAILAAFMFVRLNSIKDLLVGDGKALLDRYHKGEYKEYDIENLYIGRLNDAINRKTINQIKEVLNIFREKEIEKDFTPQNRPTGFQYVYDRFCSTEKHYKKIFRMATIAVIISILSILISIVCLSLVDYIKSSECLSCFCLLLNIIVFIVAISFILTVVIKSMKTDTLHENLNTR